MFPSKIDTRYVKRTIKRICQGDILRDVNVIDDYKRDSSGELVFEELTLPYIVVMTQDCDLEHDFNNRTEVSPGKQDKFLRTVLICPAYVAADLRKGDHLEDLKLKMEKFNSDRWSTLKKQNNTRYHYLEQDQELQVPELVIDFKHYYAIPRDTLFHVYNEHYLATINHLFREYLSQRFSNYLSRIGLPEIKGSSEKCF